MGISTVIITHNEEGNIVPCIEAASRVSDEILVIDSNSTDLTRELAQQAGARVIIKAWEGYGQAKNFGNTKAAHDWILSLDADEILSEALIEAFDRQALDTSHIYCLDRLTYFGHSAVRHSGFYPDWKARLFHRACARWDHAPVHEQLLFDKAMKRVKLEGKVYHYSYADMDSFREKQDHYARLGARKLLEAGKDPGWIKRHLGPAFRFFKTLILQGGILDGKTGWDIARTGYISHKKKWLYYRELKGTY